MSTDTTGKNMVRTLIFSSLLLIAAALIAFARYRDCSIALGVNPAPINSFVDSISIVSRGDSLGARSFHDKSGLEIGSVANDHYGRQVEEDNLTADFLRTTVSNLVWRLLQEGSPDDLSAFNSLFQNAKIHLPDESVTKKVVFNDFILDVSNVVCYNVHLDELAVNYAMATEGLTLNGSMQVSMDCDMHYSYAFGLLKGSGNLVARTSQNSLDSTMQVSQGVPPSVTVNTCAASVDIVDLDFDGGIVARIADILDGMIARIVEKQVSALICDKLSGLGSNMLNDAIVNMNERLAPYLSATPSDPVVAEMATVFAPNILNLQAETGLGSLISIAIRQLDAMLSGRVSDIGGPTGTGSDLKLNIMLRDRLLTSDRAFDVNVSNIANPVVLDRSDKITDTVMTIDAVKVYGVDTLREFSGLDLVANRTLQSKLQWDYLRVHVDMTVVMKASSRADSIIEATDAKEVVEQISIVMGVDNMDVAVSLLVALDDEKLGAVQLGSLLFSDRLVPCLLSAVDDLNVTGLDVSVTDIQDPTIAGFVSPAFDHIISQLVKAALAVYESALLQAIPGAFQLLVRDTINNQYIPDLLTSATCEPPTIADEFVDMRDLLLPPALAMERGGSGAQQYGDVGHLLYQAVQDAFMAPDINGSMTFNDMVLRPLTLAQSGTEGMFKFKTDMISFEEDNVALLAADHFEFRVSGVSVQNVDAVRAPFEMLMPIDLFQTNNSLRVGNLGRNQLTAGVRLRIAVVGDDSPLKMSNELDISATVNSVSLVSELRSVLSSKTLQEFPLRYIMDANCWLSLFPLLEDIGSPFQISSIAATLASLQMNVSCVSCTGLGTAVIPDLVNIIAGARSFRVLAKGMEKFAESLAQDGPMNEQLENMVESAHRLCPLSPTYSKSAVKWSWAFDNVQLPMESLDAVIFAAGLAAESGLTVFALGHQSPGQYGNVSAQVPSEGLDHINLLDWTDLGTSLGIGDMPDRIFKQFRTSFSQTDEAGSLFINSLMDQSVLDAGLLKISPAMSFAKSGLMFNLERIEVSGLNTFTTINVLHPTDAQTLQNTAHLHALGIKLFIRAESVNGISQQVSLMVNATDVSIDLAVLAAFDLAKLGSVTLESFFAMTSIVPCLLSTAHSFDIPRFVVNVSSFSRPVVDGLLPGSSAAITSSINAIADQFGNNLTAAVPVIFDNTVKELITSFVNHLIASNSACASPVAKSDGPVFVDFRDLLLSPDQAKKLGGSGLSQYGNLFKRIFDLVNEHFLKTDPVSGLSAINDVLIEKMTEKQSGQPGRLDFLYPFHSDTRINVGGLDANVQVRMYEAYISNVDSVGAPLAVFSPVSTSPTELNNTATIGAGPPLMAGARMVFGLKGDDMDLSNDIVLASSIEDLSVVATALLQIDAVAFRNFPIRDVLNQYCWLATIPYQPLDAQGVRVKGSAPSLALRHLSAHLAQVKLNMTCLSCSSPGLLDLSDLLATPSATTSLTKSLNNLLSYTSELLGGDYLQTAFDRLLVESQRRCPHSEKYEANSTTMEYAAFSAPGDEGTFALFIALALTILVIAMIVGVLVLTIRFIVKKRNRTWLSEQPSNTIKRLWQLQCKEKRREKYVNDATTSLFSSSVIPFWVRMFIPLCIIGNVGLFLSGHLSIGATVTIVATLGEQTVQAADFYEFSIARSTIEIWKAGGKALAMLILIVSGIWPYTKQVVTMVLWFTPTSSVSVSRRGSIFLWFDTLAKWSFVDIFVLVVTVAGFRVSVQSPNVDFLPRNFYRIDLLVVPLWGLYANMIAQIVSQVSSHYILHYHRKVIEAAEDASEIDRIQVKTAETGLTDSGTSSMFGSDNESDCIPSTDITTDNAEEALYLHAFIRPHRAEVDLLVVHRLVNRLVVPFAAVIFVFVILGCSLPVVSQDVLGIIGILVESGQDFDSATTSYSLFSMIGMLFEQARFTGRAADYIGLGTLAVILILCVLIIPIAQVGTLLYQWFKPMTLRTRRRMWVAIECLEAWQYCDVFLLAVVVAAWQLGPVSEFMVGSSCESLTDTFAQLVYYGILKAEDAQCFRVDSLLAPGAFVLAACALLLTLFDVFMKMANAQFVRDKECGHVMDEAALDSENEETDADLVDKIEPAPVLFTDRFRWLLVTLDQSTDESSVASLDSVDSNPFAINAESVDSRDLSIGSSLSFR